MICPVCQGEMSGPEFWIEDDIALHLQCADALITAVLRIGQGKSYHDYARTIIEAIYTSARRIIAAPDPAQAALF